jgi:hypothetical protein
VYKAWVSYARRWLGFDDAVVTVEPFTGNFSVRLLVSGPVVADQRLAGYSADGSFATDW